MHRTISRSIYSTASAPTPGVLIQVRPEGPIPNLLKSPIDSKMTSRSSIAQLPQHLRDSLPRNTDLQLLLITCCTLHRKFQHSFILHYWIPPHPEGSGIWEQWCHWLPARSSPCRPPPSSEVLLPIFPISQDVNPSPMVIGDFGPSHRSLLTILEKNSN